MLNSKTQERMFLDDLQIELSFNRIKKEVKACKSNCNYIFRTVYKFIPELREKNIFDKTLSLFENPIQRAFLTAWRDAKQINIITTHIKEQKF